MVVRGGVVVGASVVVVGGRVVVVVEDVVVVEVDVVGDVVLGASAITGRVVSVMSVLDEVVDVLPSLLVLRSFHIFGTSHYSKALTLMQKENRATPNT